MNLLHLFLISFIIGTSCVSLPFISSQLSPLMETTFSRTEITKNGLVEELSNESDTFCSFSSLSFNLTMPLLQVLNGITSSQFFRYYKINSYKECPYWAVSLLCSDSSNACSVCTCDQESIPTALHTSYDMSNIDIPSSFITQSVPHPLNADAWGAWLGVGFENASEKDEAEYVDLIQNPEGNTGYSGPRASSIWKAIFHENCLPFAEKDECHAFKFPKTLFSGLHTSILMHVATNFYRDTELSSPNHFAGIYNNPNISFLPNCKMFLSRVAPRNENIENLHVTYQFVLKSIQLAQSAFLENLSSYNSGDVHEETDDDKRLKVQLMKLFEEEAVAFNCFHEKKLTENAPPKTVDEVLLLFSNVTRLMDCVECQKCRIWGKLETKGLATAFRIIFGEGKISLDRAEKVALINLARQLSFSVNSFYHLNDVCQQNSSMK